MTQRKTYVAEAERDGTWWLVAIPGTYPGRGPVTQARRLDQVEEMARDFVSLFFEIPPDSFDVEVRPRLPEDLSKRLTEARELRRHAEELAARAAAATRALVAELAKDGYRIREIAHLLGMSYQRVAQLAK